MRSTRYYNKNARQLSDLYDSLSSDDVHRSWAENYLRKEPGLACDIGAGSGRDANWLANKGWDVIAVEPSIEMRALAEDRSHGNIAWLDDALPSLGKLRSLGHRFDLILLSAVWMHVAPANRERAFRIVSELLKPSGVLVISLRHGSDKIENRERGFRAVSSDEILIYAKSRALALTSHSKTPDPNRPHVQWETLVFRMPDDGTGSLPLLRHIIVNDDKSSSYKLGLLRVLTRIAEGSPGAVTKRTDDYVEIPLGLVGLYWIRQYKPLLLTHKIAQHPSRTTGYGFAKDDFYALNSVSSYDLRVGATFTDETSAVVTGAIRDACKTIVAMPVRYITYPGQNRQLFEGSLSSVRKTNRAVTLSADFLGLFGVFRMPATLWDALGQYACWLEPAILREWSALTRGWEIADYRSTDVDLFEWDDAKRNTSIPAGRVQALKAQGFRVPCVWSASNPRAPQIDHCFPWARWANNDLWNLMPASASVNLSKGDRLPSAVAMADAKNRIINWGSWPTWTPISQNVSGQRPTAHCQGLLRESPR